jgi:hypothetical protein
MALSSRTMNTLIDALASKPAALEVISAVTARMTVAIAASDTETLAGMTTPVKISAVTAGTAGNSIVITADGTSTITQLVAAWNLAHMSNQAVVSSGTASQIPTSGSFTLHGGAAAAAPVAVSKDTQRRIEEMCGNHTYGQEVVAALASGASISLRSSRALIQGMAGDGAGSAGNELLNYIQMTANASKINL